MPEPHATGEEPQKRGTSTPVKVLAVCLFVAILAIAIPNLMEARSSPGETSSIGALRTLTTAQALFREGDKDRDKVFNYAKSLEKLGEVGLVDRVLASGTKQGYTFKIIAADEFTWSATASPVAPGRFRDRHYYVDESGVIRFSTTRPATSLDTAIGG